MTDFHNPEENQVPDDFELEISDLPPSTRSHYLLLKLLALRKRWRTALAGLQPADVQRTGSPILTRNQRRAKIGQALTTLGLCAALLLLLIGNLPNLRTRLIGLFEPTAPAAPTAIAYSSSAISQGNVSIIIEQPNDPNNDVTVIPASGLGPLPATCPKVSTLQSFLTILDPPGMGNGPLWLTGFNGPTAALTHLQTASTAMSQPPGAIFGWYQTLTIFIQRGFTGTLVLHGASQRGNNELEFSYTDALNFAPVLNLSLDDPAGVHFAANGDWEMTPINILVPAAGCYTLQTSWSNYTWTQYFAAGNR